MGPSTASAVYDQQRCTSAPQSCCHRREIPSCCDALYVVACMPKLSRRLPVGGCKLTSAGTGKEHHAWMHGSMADKSCAPDQAHRHTSCLMPMRDDRMWVLDVLDRAHDMHPVVREYHGASGDERRHQHWQNNQNSFRHSEWMKNIDKPKSRMRCFIGCWLRAE